MRRYFDYSATGAFSLEAEDVLESGPTRVGDGLREVAVLEHVLAPKVLDGNKGVSVNVLAGRLVGVVLTLAGDLEVPPRRLSRRLTLAGGTLLATRRLALRPTELLLRLLEAARVFDGVPVGVRDEVSEPHVEADGGTVPLLWRFSEVADDENIPMTVGSKDEVSGPWSTFERAVLLDLYAAAELLWNSQPAGIGVEVHVPARAVLTELYRVPSIGALEAREADLPPEFLTVKEPLEGFAEPVGESLYRGLRNMLPAASLEPICEVIAAKELAGLLAMTFDHFQHLVVKTAAFRQTRKEHPALNATRIQAVFKRFAHVPTVP